METRRNKCMILFSAVRPVIVHLLMAVAVVTGANALGLILRFASRLSVEMIAGAGRFLLGLWKSPSFWLTFIILLIVLLSVGVAKYRSYSPRSSLKVASGLLLVLVTAPVLALLLYALAKAVISLILWRKFQDSNFLVSFVVVCIPLLTTLRPSVLRQQSWKVLKDIWLKWSRVPAISIGGFGFIGLLTDQGGALLKIAMSRSQLSIRYLIICYIVCVMMLGLANLFLLVGRASASTEESHRPALWFVPAFALSWLSNLGIFTLFVNGMTLTLLGHLAGTGNVTNCKG